MKNFGISLPRNINQIVAMSGFALCVMAGFGFPIFWPVWLIPVLGAFIGYSSVNDAKGFLLAGLSLIAAKWGLRFVPVVGGFAQDIAGQLINLVAPAMLIVSVKLIYDQVRR